MTEYCSGAVLYTRVDGEVRYVVVRELEGHCGLPKGHIEPNESPEAAALREIFEETGVHAVIEQGFVRTTQYASITGKQKHITYYLASYADQSLSCDSSVDAVLLLPMKEALLVLHYPAVREVLMAADAAIRAQNKRE